MFSINLTDAAVREVKRLRSKYDDPDMCLRLGVKASGCSGMSYTMAFESEPKQADELFEFNDCKVVVDPLSLSIIDGMTVDFSEDLLGGGFRFENPNAVNTCGCGTSFTPGESATAAASAS